MRQWQIVTSSNVTYAYAASDAAAALTAHTHPAIGGHPVAEVVSIEEVR